MSLVFLVVKIEKATHDHQNQRRQSQERLLRKAVEVLLGGGLIAYPTEHHYAIGCDLYNLRGIARIYQLKRRPTSKPFSFICHDLKNISEYAQVSNYAIRS